MPFPRSPVGAVLAVLILTLLAALPARAVRTVSTSDGMTLTLTDTGAFSSLTVDGNAAPTLSGVTGGFYIVPMDGVAIDLFRKTFYSGTQITGTATQNGSNVTITGTAQNQSFSITLTGGLPYIKVDGTVTGNGDDHAFLVDFRLPIDANGWTWGNRLLDPQVIDTGSNANWYFADGPIMAALHPRLSVNPYGTITRNGSGSGSANMGVSLSPLFYPPAAYAIEYNAQGGLWIEFELGTTPKTTKHPNTADFHFILYKHAPKWGNRSAVQRGQSFFPGWFNRTVSGGNWFLAPNPITSIPSTPTDFRLKFSEGGGYDTTFTQTNGIITCPYTEAWCWHEWTVVPSELWPETLDAAANWVRSRPPCHCPGSRGLANAETAQATFNSVAMNPDATLIGPDNPSLWTDYNGMSWRWIMNPDPELANWQGFTPGSTRAGTGEFREWYGSWGSPPGSGDLFSGLYHDSIGGAWAGWSAAHNFHPQHWATFDYSPGISWNSDLRSQYGNGLVTMWAPFSNVEWLKYTYEQMRRDNRIVYANTGPCTESAMIAPFLDAWGTESVIANVPLTNQALMRVVAGGKPLSFITPRTGYNTATTTEMLATLPFAVYPGGGSPSSGNTAEYEAARTTYQQFMPIFDTLDAANWNPITAAAPADSTQILERFGPDSSGAVYYVLRVVNAAAATVTVYSSDLGWSSSPNVTVTSLYGTAPSTSFDGNGDLVLSFGSISANDDRVVKLVYNGTPTVPAAAFTANNTTVAVNTAVNFTDQSTATPTGWYWDFGDGNVSLSQNPSHTYTAGGQYIVSLTASNASGQSTCTKDRYLTVTQVPVAVFSWYRVSGVIGTETTAEFRDRSSNSPTSWSWTFGDGGTSTAQNPTHTYTAAGTYSVSLTATNASGSSSPFTKTDLVVIYPIKAIFTASPTFGSPSLAVSFTDQSAGTPTSWSWTFGDGGTSTAQNPSHTYTSAGYYSPSLTVTNANGQNTIASTNYITVCDEVIVYPDSYVGQNGTTWVSGALTDVQSDDSNYLVLSTPNGTSTYQAQFFADTSYTPAQVYGIGYDVKVHASPASSFSGYVTIYDPAASGWPWDGPTVGGLLTSNDQWITRLGAAGNPKISATGLIGLALCGCRDSGYPNGAFSGCFNVVRFHIYLRPGAGTAPVANFSGTPTSGLLPLAVTFTDSSTNSPTSWSWSFGDSTSSTAQNPSHTYASAGSYTVALAATNASGTDTETKTDYITVTNTVSFAPASASGSPLVSGALSDLATSNNAYMVWANYQNSVKSLPLTFSWSTGYTPSQVTKLKMEYELHSSEASTPVVRTYNYKADGNPDSQQSIANTVPGTSDVWLSWESTDVATYLKSDGTFSCLMCNCGNAAQLDYQLSVDTACLTLTLAGGSAPVANFSGTPTTGAAPLAVTFTDSSTNTPTSWSWSFGDSATSTAQNPSHTYTRAGTYTVALTATNAQGYDSETKTNYITAGDPPVANFSGTPTSGAAPLAVTFTDSSTNTPTSWSWSFGDSATSTAQNPSHTYTSAGTYTVALTATNAYGNDSETKTNYLTVAASFAPASVANGGPLVSGSLSDLTTSNDAYMVWANNQNGVKSLSMTFAWSTGYTPSQVSKLKMEYELHSSLASTPVVRTYNYKADGNVDSQQSITNTVPGTSDVWLSWESTDVSTYLKSDGTFSCLMCICGNAAQLDYQVSVDTARLTVTLAP